MTDLPDLPALILKPDDFPTATDEYLTAVREGLGPNAKVFGRVYSVEPGADQSDVIGSFLAKSSDLAPELEIAQAIEHHENDDVQRAWFLLERMARNDRVDRLLQNLGFAVQSPFTLAGSLAATLFDGGAYGQTTHTPTQCMAMSEAALQWLLHDPLRQDIAGRGGSLTARHSHLAWTPWFFDIAWDETWLVHDRAAGKLLVMAISATD